MVFLAWPSAPASQTGLSNGGPCLYRQPAPGRAATVSERQWEAAGPHPAERSDSEFACLTGYPLPRTSGVTPNATEFSS